MGVGMVDGDCIFIFLDMPDITNTVLMDLIVETGIREARRNEEISFGLNLTLDDPLPLLHVFEEHEHPTAEMADNCSAQLNCLKNVLFQAFDMTIETYTLPLPEHLPDFSKIILKLNKMNYVHADKCMSDVYDVLARYENSAYILENTGKVEEGERRLNLKRDLSKTLKEFQQAIQSYNGEVVSEMCFNDFWEKDEYRKRYIFFFIFIQGVCLQNRRQILKENAHYMKILKSIMNIFFSNMNIFSYVYYLENPLPLLLKEMYYFPEYNIKVCTLLKTSDLSLNWGKNVF